MKDAEVRKSRVAYQEPVEIPVAGIEEKAFIAREQASCHVLIEEFAERTVQLFGWDRFQPNRAQPRKLFLMPFQAFS